VTAVAHQQRTAEQVGAAGEEDPVDRAAHLCHAGARLRTGQDDHVAGGYPDHQVAGHRVLQVVPEPVGQQHAGFQPVERQHQRRRLAVKTHALQRGVQVGRGLPPQFPRRESEVVQVMPGEQPLAVTRPHRVGHGEAVHELLHHVTVRDLRIVVRHQEGEKGGTSHLHACQPSRILRACKDVTAGHELCDYPWSPMPAVSVIRH
jgi:hypothetical protein